MNSQDSSPMIEADGLCKFYGGFAAAKDVSFKINRGEVVAFLGPNGAGKSTVMKMLTGYLSPSRGRGFIMGHDMAKDRLRGAERLGYLPENGPLYADMTPNSLLSFFGDARGMTKKQRAARIEKVVELCALGSVFNKSIGKLSKGFRQRVGMAQTLLHEPDVLIMDEPTAGLDPNQIHGVRKLLQRIGKEKTILLSTHIMQEVAAIASRAIIISEGTLRYDGSIGDLTKDEKDLDLAFRKLTQSTAAA